MTRHFYYIGLPTDDPQPGETYVEETKARVTRPENHREGAIEFSDLQAA